MICLPRAACVCFLNWISLCSAAVYSLHLCFKFCFYHFLRSAVSLDLFWAGLYSADERTAKWLRVDVFTFATIASEESARGTVKRKLINC